MIEKVIINFNKDLKEVNFALFMIVNLECFEETMITNFNQFILNANSITYHLFELTMALKFLLMKFTTIN